MQLAGKRALVTGSSRGIGLGVARAFADAGASVVVTSEHAAVPEIADLLNRTGVFYVAADLTRDGEPERLAGEAWDRLGGIDIVVNNVGTFAEPAFLDLRRDDFDFIFRLNVWAAIAVSREVVRRAVPLGQGGRILFTTSLNGSRSEPAHTLYDASKGAINALTRQLAVELAPLGFTTAAVAPSLVETPLTDFGLASDPVTRQRIVEQIPIHRIATVDDVSGWFVFLASDAARYATGTVVTVDGGLDAQQMPTRPVIAAERGDARRP